MGKAPDKEVEGDTVVERLGNMDNEQRTSALTTFFVIGLIFLAGIWWGWGKVFPDKPEIKPVKIEIHSPASEFKATKKTAVADRRGSTARDLGKQSAMLGSSDQAAALVQLMEENPGMVDYKITFETNAGMVLFWCNFEKDVIIRIHTRPNGHGSTEKWVGYIEERLAAGAAGHSLNDTPKGKIPVHYELF